MNEPDAAAPERRGCVEMPDTGNASGMGFLSGLVFWIACIMASFLLVFSALALIDIQSKGMAEVAIEAGLWAILAALTLRLGWLARQALRRR